MQAVRKKKGVSSSGCYVCGQKGHLARDCKSKSDSGQSSARSSGSTEASGPGEKKHGCFKCGQPGRFTRESKQGRTWFFSCCAATSMKGDDLIVDAGCTDYVVRDRAVFSSFEGWNEGITVQNLNGTLSRIEGKGLVEVEIRDCHDTLFTMCCCVTSYSVNLMSVSSAVPRGSSFSFAADELHLLAPDEGQLPVEQRGKLFFLECNFKRNPITLVTKTRRDTSNASFD